jgi:nicotinamidase/pyrazinamidase
MENNMKALLLIDIQKDFCKGGALEVPNGDDVVSVANEWINKFNAENGIIVATQDWHPANHKSFASNNAGKNLFELTELNGLPQVMWPNHCVENTVGAEFHDDLLPIPFVFCKGEDTEVDSYSGFFDNGKRNKTQLDSFLKEHNVDELIIMGLATDYCVKFTVLDALELGYKVTVPVGGCRAVNMPSGSGDAAIQEMKIKGANII